MFILCFVRFWFGNGNQNHMSEQNDKTVMIRCYLVNFDVACKMEFHQYPIDMQTCEIKLESFGYTSKQMRFRWLSGNQFKNKIRY